MPYFRLILLAYAALVMETSLADWLIAGTTRPSLLPLVVVAAALTLEGWPGIAFAAMVGLLADCLSPGGLGVEMLCALWVALALQQVRRERREESALVLTGLSFFAVFAIVFSSTVVRNVFAGHAVVFAEAVPAVTWIAAVSALICFATVLTWRSAKRLAIAN